MSQPLDNLLPQPHAWAPILPVFLIVLVDVFGMTLVLPLLGPYAERQLGATAFQATLLVSVYAACQLVSGPIIGKISDRTGRKPMLLISQVGTLAGFLLMARTTSLWVVYLARVIDGSTAGNISLAQAYIADNTEPKNRAKSFALIGIAFGLGFFAGPWLSGELSTRFYLYTPFYVAAGMSATSILATAALLRGGKPPQHPQTEGAPGPGGKRLAVFNWGAYVEYFKRPELGTLLCQFFCFMLSFSLFTSGFALFAERRFTWRGHPFTPREIGYCFAYAGFLGIILQGGLVGRLVKKFGEPALIVAGFISLGIGYLVLGFAHAILLLGIAATVSSFGNGVLRPALTSLITQRAGRHEQGVVLGLTQSLTSVAAIISPSIAGKLIEYEWLSQWCWAAAAAGGIGLVLTLLTRRLSAEIDVRKLAAPAGAIDESPEVGAG